MQIMTGEVVPTPSHAKPFKVVITFKGEIMNEWPVESEEEGNRQIGTVIRGVGEAAKAEGYI